MEVKIYLIEDCDGLKYVGSTKYTLNQRLIQHKKSSNLCSSNKLNLNDCVITELECCDDSNRKEREQYYIDAIDCVNILNTVFDKKEWREKNKEKIREYHKEYDKQYREKNKEKIKERNKLDWYCSHCKCNVKKKHKSNHLKTQKHQLNINN